MPDIDLQKLIQDMLARMLLASGKDASVLSTFVRAEAERLAREAARVAALYKAGKIDKEMFEYAINDIALSMRNLVKVMMGLSGVTAERAWNAGVGAIWEAVSRIIGVTLPVPRYN